MSYKYAKEIFLHQTATALFGRTREGNCIQKFSLRQMSEIDLPPGQRTGTETYF